MKKKKGRNLFINWIKGYDDSATYKIAFLLFVVGFMTRVWTINVVAFFLLILDASITGCYSSCYRKEYDAEWEKGVVFPPEQVGTPKYFRFLFTYAHFDVERVPKIAIKYIYTDGVIAAVFGIFMIGVLFWQSGILGETTIPLYVLPAFFVTVYTVLVIFRGFAFEIKANRITFKNKYKKITWGNVKYLLWRGLFVGTNEKEPSCITLGKCCVIDVRKKGRKKYADVRMVKDGEIYRDVLMECDTKTDTECWLKEICRVKYIE